MRCHDSRSGHGGARKGAGRKRRSRESVPHSPRPVFDGQRQPVHVTLRMARSVWNLRSQRGFRCVEHALRAEKARGELRVVHYSVQGNHAHLIVETADRSTLSRRMQGFSIRLARAVNKMMKRPRGRVLAERYHANVLRTARQVHNTIRYVLLNHAKHSAQAGRSGALIDPFSSGPFFEHWATPLRRATFAVGTGPPPIVAARTRLLSEGWLRYGAIQP